MLDYAPFFSVSSTPYIGRRNMNLTYLANVRSWVNSQSSTDDALLNRLIAEASRTILNYLQRADIGLTSVTEIISGRGERRIQMEIGGVDKAKLGARHACFSIRDAYKL